MHLVVLICAIYSLLGLVAVAHSQSPILFYNAKIVNADRSFHGSVLLFDGIIQSVSEDVDSHPMQVPVDTRTIDAKGQLLMPGGIDPHTHLDMPFMGTTTIDDFTSGQEAAAAGGTTMHIDFALPWITTSPWDLNPGWTRPRPRQL